MEDQTEGVVQCYRMKLKASFKDGGSHNGCGPVHGQIRLRVCLVDCDWNIGVEWCWRIEPRTCSWEIRLGPSTGCWEFFGIKYK